jgi:hypothetical protein
MMVLLNLALLLALSVPAQPSLIQVASSRSKNGSVAVTLSNQVIGDDNLVAVAFCESACSADPANDKVRVSDTSGNFCAVLGSVTNGNQQLSLWRCSNIKAAASNTIHAYIFLGPNEPSGLSIAASIAVSEWQSLGSRILVPQPGDFTFAAGIGMNGGASGNAQVVNPWDGTIITQAGIGPMVWTCPAPMASMAVGFSVKTSLPGKKK